MYLTGMVKEVTGACTDVGCSTDHGMTGALNVRVPGTDGSKLSPNTLNQSVGVGPILLVSLGGALAMLWRLHSERNRLPPPFPPGPTR
jgi:hypothetical protein